MLYDKNIISNTCITTTNIPFDSISTVGPSNVEIHTTSVMNGIILSSSSLSHLFVLLEQEQKKYYLIMNLKETQKIIPLTKIFNYF